MRKIFVCMMASILCIQADVGITYLDRTRWGGRLGDQLMMYVKAKIISHYTAIPLYINYFTYADSFVFWKKENHLSNFNKKKSEEVVLHTLSTFENIRNAENKLFVTHYYFQLNSWGEAQKKYDTQEIMDWKELMQNQELLQEIRSLLEPIDEIPLLLPPSNILSVAVHVRKTSENDTPMVSNQLYNVNKLDVSQSIPRGNFSDINYPTKHLPDQYYIDQIKRLYQLVGEKPLYVFIFTDYKYPERLCRLYENQCKSENITFCCRTGEHNQVNTQIQDIVSMARYNYLIRGGSNFPQISQLMGNHRLVIYPKSVKWVGSNLIVNEVAIYENP